MYIKITCSLSTPPRRFPVSMFYSLCIFAFKHCCLDLESEMYQLSHLLSEQKSLLNALSTTSVLGDETPIITEIDKAKRGEDEDEVKQKIAEIIERVEGCTVSRFCIFRFLFNSGATNFCSGREFWMCLEEYYCTKEIF